MTTTKDKTLYEKALAYGIVEDFALYNKRRPDCLTSHQFITYCRDPIEAKKSEELKPEVAIGGSAFHCAMLEPDNFDKDFVVMPRYEATVRKKDGSEYDNPKASKAYKELKAAFELENKDRYILSRDMFNSLKFQMSSYAEFRLLKSILGNCINETTFLTEINGIKIQSRPDMLNFYNGDNEYDVIDLKTIDDISRWNWAIRDYRYDIQLWFYGRIMGHILGKYPKRLLIAFIEKSDPNRHMLVEVEPILWVGAVKSFIDKKLVEFKDSLDNGFESKYGREIVHYVDTRDLK
jgi:hypothetical protein